jgi:hypothetical protein
MFHFNYFMFILNREEIYSDLLKLIYVLLYKKQKFGKDI